MSDGKILSGGGKDRKVIEWNQYLQKTGHEVEVIVRSIINYSFNNNEPTTFLTLLVRIFVFLVIQQQRKLL